MIDERELSALLDLETAQAAPSAPPLRQVVHRGRRLRRRRQMGKAASVVAVAALVVGVARVIPAPSQEIRTASVPGEHTALPELTAPPEGGPSPTTVTSSSPQPHHEGPKTGKPDGPAVAPTTSTTISPTTTTTKPIPHSTVVTGNGKLAGLVVSGLSPAFDPNTAYYTAPGDEHDGMMVTATLADADANLYIQSTRVDSGEPFKAWVGDGRSVDIVIYSDWKEIGRYVVTKPGDTPPPPPAPHSTVVTGNGKLAGLTATGLSPAFDPATANYAAPADHDVITVTATLADPNANLFIQSTQVNSGQPFRAWVGDGKSVDVVIYSDWTEIGRYTITRSN